MVRMKKSLKGLRLFTVSLVALGLITMTACSSSDGGGGSTTGTPLQGLASCTAQAGSSVVCGTVFAGDGTTPVVGATVSQVSSSSLVVQPLGSLTTDGLGGLTANPDACLTDDAGAFACLVSGSGSLTFQLTGGIFGTTPQEFTATLTEGETATVASIVFDVVGQQWLVVPGIFDGIQLLLAALKPCVLTGDTSVPQGLRGSPACEMVGLKVLDDAEVATFLANEDLSTYDAIFANCSSDFSSDSDVTSALQNYVNNGGNMYFSDLSDDWLTPVFPGLITYPADKNSTSSGTLSGATVSDTGLEAFLGSSTIEIEFDLGVWTAMASISSGTTFIEGDISSLAPTITGTKPIAVGVPQGSGCVFYTSYHVEGAAAGSPQENALRYLVTNRLGECD